MDRQTHRQQHATIILIDGNFGRSQPFLSLICGIFRPPHVKVICPTANKMPVTLNSGFQMPSWFDLLSLDPAGKEDEAGIEKAAQVVDLIIAEELKTGIPADRIMIGKDDNGMWMMIH